MTFKTLSAALMASTLAVAGASGAFAQSSTGMDNMSDTANGITNKAGDAANGAMNTMDDTMDNATDTMKGQDMAASGSASASGNMSYGDIISNIRNGSDDPSMWSQQLASLDQDATVNVVPLSELKGQAGQNAQALDQAVADSSADMSAVKDEIDANQTLKVALEDKDYTADDVVALQVDGSSDVTLVVDDKG